MMEKMNEKAKDFSANPEGLFPITTLIFTISLFPFLGEYGSRQEP